MGHKFPTLPLGELCASSPHAIAIGPFGSSIKTDNFVASGVPVIRGGNLGEGRFSEDNFVFLTEQKADELRNANVFAGDIVLTHRGTLGQVGIIPARGRFRRYVISQSQMKVTLDTSRVDPLFVFYFLRSPVGQDQILSYASTTGVPAIAQPTTSLKRLVIPVPPLPEQRAITRVLGSLDDKIELNRRMNQTLEEICRALFKFWFVDFGPVRAKMEGRWKKGESLPGMPADMWDLWPSEFEESEIGEIPKGWALDTVGDLAEFRYGEPLKERDRNGGRIPVFGSNGIIGWHDRRLVEGPGIVVGRKGNPGTVTWANGDFWPIDTTFYVVRRKESPPMDYLFYALAQLDLPSLEADSAVPGLNRRAAIGSRIVVPQPEVTSCFETMVTPLRSRVAHCLAESGTLSALRDTLIPKLLSGEIRVKVDS